jgi:hypothetical protein
MFNPQTIQGINDRQPPASIAGGEVATFSGDMSPNIASYEQLGFSPVLASDVTPYVGSYNSDPYSGSADYQGDPGFPVDGSQSPQWEDEVIKLMGAGAELYRQVTHAPGSVTPTQTHVSSPVGGALTAQIPVATLLLVAALGLVLYIAR